MHTRRPYTACCLRRAEISVQGKAEGHMTGKRPDALMPWSLVTSLTAGGVMLFEIFLFLGRDLWVGGHTVETLYWVWMLAAAILLVLAGRQRVDPGVFAVVSIMGGSVVSLPLLVLPDRWWPVPTRYGAIVSRYSDETYESGLFDQPQYLYDLEQGSLHVSSCPLLIREVREASGYQQEVGLQRFVTWQRGLAAGFWPHRCVTAYRYPRSVVQRIWLFLTVGPAVLFEAALTGLLTTFPLALLGQWLYRRYAREDVWKGRLF